VKLALARSLAAVLLRRGLRGVATLVTWTVWLGLILLLAVQAYMATHHELGVPQFVLRALEQRLAASGLHADFGRTQFDPSGRILVRDVRITLPGFEEPVVSAASIYGRLDWWALIAGRFEPVEVRVTGVSARVPAMLSPSGRADEVVHDLDGTFFPHGSDISVPFVTGWIGTMKIAAQGTLHLTAPRSHGTGPLPLADLIAHQYAVWSSQAVTAGTWIAAMENPVLRAELIPTAPGVSEIDFSLSADSAKTPEGEVTGARIVGAWIAGAAPGTPATVLGSARRLILPGGYAVERVAARVSILQGNAGGTTFGANAQSVDFAAAQLSVQGLTVQAPFGRIEVADYPRVEVVAGLRAWDHPILFSVNGDVSNRSGTVAFDAAIGAGILGTLQSVLRADLRAFLGWSEPVVLAGTARFGPGARFVSANVQVTARGLTARGVTIDELRGEVQFDGARLFAPRAYARLGDDFARGSFEQVMATRNYRFLLDGRLRPLHITPWIAGNWWTEFFSNLGFPVQGPDANIDLSGCWTDGRQAKIFLRVDAPGIAIEGMPLDRLLGRTFIRPQFSDVLAFSAQRGGGVAEGSFVRRYDLDAGDWRSLDVAVTSTLDPLPPLKLLGGSEAVVLSDFTFASPPHLTVTGHFDGPAGGSGVHRQLQVGMRSDGLTSYRGIPIDRLGFDATLTDDAIALTGLDATIAGGTVAGKMALSGATSARHLDVSATARNVSLSQAAALVEKLSATPPGTTATKAQKFLQDKSSVKIDAGLSAEGNLAALDSFHGSGSAQLHGGEIGEIHILGMLSQLLRFTALRFTAAQATFQLNGAQLIFPEVVISGANSAITAHGSYSLALHQLDFRARLDPFKQSQGATRKFMDLVLTPLSNALEVRLTGSVDKPKWAFVNGPTNLLWNMRPPNSVVPAQTGFANPP